VTTAFLLTCHGTVDKIEDIPAFLANIRRGRPVPREIIEEVTRRFERIGGSPLMRITQAQADALAARLNLPVRVAGRLFHPYPKDVIAELHASGARTIVSLPLAPQSVHVYHAAVREAAAAYPDLTLREVPPWGLEPALIDAFVESIDETLESAPAPESERSAIPIVLTAHSLPVRAIQAGDPYEAQFRAMASAVEDRLRARGNPTFVAFQSQGMTGDAWLGPDLPETFSRVAAAGARGVLIAPIGFVADHVETLYDLDIEARPIAERAGLTRFLRAPAMNTRARFIDALDAIARRALEA
jgi:ferrochelatase